MLIFSTINPLITSCNHLISSCVSVLFVLHLLLTLSPNWTCFGSFCACCSSPHISSLPLSPSIFRFFTTPKFVVFLLVFLFLSTSFFSSHFVSFSQYHFPALFLSSLSSSFSHFSFLAAFCWSAIIKAPLFQSFLFILSSFSFPCNLLLILLVFLI